ncbi:RNA polymerase factor sigma-54 [Tyzzerella sp. OttesenSCG-928-J15]|nr:RNA polymerase factor sigma-54 [Tyzzerella sp. OttesenSCG-928-J15]
MDMELSIQQKHMLSQRMQLSVSILKMGSMELRQYLYESSLENPLIELIEPEHKNESISNETRMKKIEWLDSSDNSKFHQKAPVTEERYIPLNNKYHSESLKDILLSQIPGLRLDSQMDYLVKYIIENLNENGYLCATPEDISSETGYSIQDVKYAISIVHQMDPPGVGAADLCECLRLQALRLEPPPTLLFDIIDNYMECLSKNQLLKISKELNVAIDEVKSARDLLLRFNPRPGNGYSSNKHISYVRPELTITQSTNGFHVVFDDKSLPKLEINSYYVNLIKENNSETTDYLNAQLDKAEWLVSCINQRQNTICRCAEAILRRQLQFFNYGPGNLVPMTLNDVAEDLSVHPSTISRAVRDKYLECRWGIFALSDFFSRTVGKDNGDHSGDSIQNEINNIINAEDSSKPYSDQDIAVLLGQRGIKIARRTVAKYRDQMGIAPAIQRRKY